MSRSYSGRVAGDLLGGVSGEQRQQVESRLARRRFAKGEVLFHEGEPGDSLHIIERGRVAVQVSTPQGDVVTLTVLGAGSSFGEQALIDPLARRTATVVALEVCETRVLHRAEFDDLRARFPAVDRFLVEVLAAHVRRLSRQVVEALHVPVELRVVRRLVDLAELYAPDSASGAPSARGGLVDIPVRQEDLASMAGTTRPTANMVLKRLEADGVIALSRGHVVVLDGARLRAAAR